jgi:hypothetical protein
VRGRVNLQRRRGRDERLRVGTLAEEVEEREHGHGTHECEEAAASLKVYAPSHLRGGLLYEARFHITAREELKEATLVLGSGWLEGMTLNTIEPGPVSEASNNGRLSLDLGHIPAGESYVLYVQFQVNPTNVGRRTQSVELMDGGTSLLSYERELTVFP